MPLIENQFYNLPPSLPPILLISFLLIQNCFSDRAIPVGAVSYVDIDGYRYKRDVLFCYDLKLPESFRPENQGSQLKLNPSQFFYQLLSLTLATFSRSFVGCISVANISFYLIWRFLIGDFDLCKWLVE